MCSRVSAATNSACCSSIAHRSRRSASPTRSASRSTISVSSGARARCRSAQASASSKSTSAPRASRRSSPRPILPAIRPKTAAGTACRSTTPRAPPPAQRRCAGCAAHGCARRGPPRHRSSDRPDRRVVPDATGTTSCCCALSTERAMVLPGRVHSGGGRLQPDAFPRPLGGREGALRDIVPSTRDGVEEATFTVAINLSGTTLSDPGFLEFRSIHSKRTSRPPGVLCFEVTENRGDHESRPCELPDAEVGGRGCLIALDDFGSGAFVLQLPRTWPVNYLKIDGTSSRTSRTIRSTAAWSAIVPSAGRSASRPSRSVSKRRRARYAPPHRRRLRAGLSVCGRPAPMSGSRTSQ